MHKYHLYKGIPTIETNRWPDIRAWIKRVGRWEDYQLASRHNPTGVSADCIIAGAYSDTMQVCYLFKLVITNDANTPLATGFLMFPTSPEQQALADLFINTVLRKIAEIESEQL